MYPKKPNETNYNLKPDNTYLDLINPIYFPLISTPQVSSEARNGAKLINNQKHRKRVV